MERLLKDSVFARSSFQGLGEFITLPGIHLGALDGGKRENRCFGC